MTTPRDSATDALLQAVLATEPEELNCEQFFANAAAYLDSCLLETEATAPQFDRVRQHLRVCPECADAFEAMICAHPDANRDVAGA